MRNSWLPEEEAEEMLCKAHGHCRAIKQLTLWAQTRGDLRSFSSFAADTSGGLSCSSRSIVPLTPGLIHSKESPFSSLFKSYRLHKEQPGYPSKQKTSELPYPEKLFWLFHHKDHVFVGIFGLLNLAIIDQYSSSQCIFKVEGKHWKRLWRLPTLQHQVLETWLCRSMGLK